MDEPEIKIVNVFMCKIRKKLAIASGGKDYIETVWGRGYPLREPQEVKAKVVCMRCPHTEKRQAMSVDLKKLDVGELRPWITIFGGHFDVDTPKPSPRRPAIAIEARSLPDTATTRLPG
jgi:hypothetical protein